MSEKVDERIIYELNITNRLLALILTKDSNNQTERITLLNSNGFSPSQIADLLKIKDNIVTASLSQSKAKKTKEKQ
jgi:hypothetical protein